MRQVTENQSPKYKSSGDYFLEFFNFERKISFLKRKIDIQITQKGQFFDLNDYDFRIPHAFYYKKLKKNPQNGRLELKSC